MTLENKKLLTYTLIAFVFAFALRLIWVAQFSDNKDFYWNDQIMINTNDGYWFAEGARDILAGTHQDNDLSPITHPMAKLTALLATILPFSFETIILYMSAFFGSLLVIPIMLLGKSIKELDAGFIGALLGSIAWSYYNRTMTGYYDTDMLNIVLPTFILYSMVQAIQVQKNRYLILIPFFIMAYQIWYHGSYSLNFAFVAIMVLYTLVFERKNVFFYKTILFMSVAMISTYLLLKVLIVLALFYYFHTNKKVNLKFIWALIAATIIFILISGGLNPILVQLKSYIFRDVSSNEQSLHFYNVAQTVREAGKIPFETFANRISGSRLMFIASFGAYIMLLFRFRIMLLSLPMVALGFLAYVGGLRFTVYAVPIMALALGYLVVMTSRNIKNTKLKYLFVAFAMLFILFPNIAHIIAYKVPVVFDAKEVKILSDMQKYTSKDDYVMTWWDYGYPIRYYADVKTFVDGGKHAGDVNYPVSLALTKPQELSANIARATMEYDESAFKEKRAGSYIKMMMKDYNVFSGGELIDLMSASALKLPKKTADIYYYLPMRMLSIYQTVELFSNIDIDTGKMGKSPFFYQTTHIKDMGSKIDLGRGIYLDKAKGSVNIQGKEIPLAMFITTKYNQFQKLDVNKQVINVSGNLIAIFMRDYGRFLILDSNSFESTYIQLFVLENYDKNLFEPVEINPMVKIYKLKI